MAAAAAVIGYDHSPKFLNDCSFILTVANAMGLRSEGCWLIFNSLDAQIYENCPPKGMGSGRGLDRLEADVRDHIVQESRQVRSYQGCLLVVSFFSRNDVQRIDRPLKIRVDIRDKWDSPSTDVHSSIDSLSKTLGHKIVPQIQWSPLYNGLKDHYEDKSLFVPTVLNIVRSFYSRLLSRLDNESETEWTEQLLNELAKKPANVDWNLNVDIGAKSLARPRLSWKPLLEAFLLEIPGGNLPLGAQVEAGFDQDLDNLFRTGSGLTKSTPSELNDDEWADVSEVEPHITPSKVAHPPALSVEQGDTTRPVVTKLASLDTLYRPSDLFKSTTPYTLIVDASTVPLIIQGSHQPSLELIAGYLKKWAKTNAQDSMKRPIYKVDLHESAFCFGLIDCVSIEPYISYRGATVNPALILAFVEGVLGYKEVYTTGHRWIFKSNKILQ